MLQEALLMFKLCFAGADCCTLHYFIRMFLPVVLLSTVVIGTCEHFLAMCTSVILKASHTSEDLSALQTMVELLCMLAFMITQIRVTAK